MTFWQKKQDSATLPPQTSSNLPQIDALFAGISTQTATFALG
jgi:hypothetical protein